MVPKFRAWDKENEIYLYNVQYAYDTLSGFVKYDDGEYAEYGEDCFGNFLNNKRYVVEQYTGLKDVNGKEIYEGDIIQYFGANRRMKVKKEFGVVVFKTDKYGSKFTSVIQNAEHGFGGISPLNDLVVGDIHNNPELLKVNK